MHIQYILLVPTSTFLLPKITYQHIPPPASMPLFSFYTPLGTVSAACWEVGCHHWVDLVHALHTYSEFMSVQKTALHSTPSHPPPPLPRCYQSLGGGVLIQVSHLCLSTSGHLFQHCKQLGLFISVHYRTGLLWPRLRVVLICAYKHKYLEDSSTICPFGKTKHMNKDNRNNKTNRETRKQDH